MSGKFDLNRVDCPICNHDESHFYLNYINKKFKYIDCLNNLKIKVCQNCGFGFSFPEIQDELVKNFYEDEYRKYGSEFYIPFNNLNTRPARLEPRSLAQILLAKQYVDFMSKDYFIDIGPGGGSSFNAALEALTNPRLIAIEINKGASDAYSRLYGATSIANIKLFVNMGSKAKIILLSHFLEHYKLSLLEEILQELRGAISPNGCLVIEVPNDDMRIYGEHRVDDSPHFLFFSKRSLAMLFERNNWQILFIDTCGPPIDINNIQNISPAENPNTTKKASTYLGKVPRAISLLMPNSLRTKLLKLLTYSQVDFNNPEFSYGGARSCLRIVVKAR